MSKGVGFESNYSLGRRLGRGHYGDVNLCSDKATGDIFAVKIMKVARRQQSELAENEIDILKDICHDNVVWLKEAIWTPNSMLYLVMEL